MSHSPVEPETRLSPEPPGSENNSSLPRRNTRRLNVKNPDNPNALAESLRAYDHGARPRPPSGLNASVKEGSNTSVSSSSSVKLVHQPKPPCSDGPCRPRKTTNSTSLVEEESQVDINLELVGKAVEIHREATSPIQKEIIGNNEKDSQNISSLWERNTTDSDEGSNSSKDTDADDNMVVASSTTAASEVTEKVTLGQPNCSSYQDIINATELAILRMNKLMDNAKTSLDFLDQGKSKKASSTGPKAGPWAPGKARLNRLVHQKSRKLSEPETVHEVEERVSPIPSQQPELKKEPALDGGLVDEMKRVDGTGCKAKITGTEEMGQPEPSTKRSKKKVRFENVVVEIPIVEFESVNEQNDIDQAACGDTMVAERTERTNSNEIPIQRDIVFYGRTTPLNDVITKTSTDVAVFKGEGPDGCEGRIKIDRGPTVSAEQSLDSKPSKERIEAPHLPPTDDTADDKTSGPDLGAVVETTDQERNPRVDPSDEDEDEEDDTYTACENTEKMADASDELREAWMVLLEENIRDKTKFAIAKSGSDEQLEKHHQEYDGLQEEAGRGYDEVENKRRIIEDFRNKYPGMFDEEDEMRPLEDIEMQFCRVRENLIESQLNLSKFHKQYLEDKLRIARCLGNGCTGPAAKIFAQHYSAMKTTDSVDPENCLHSLETFPLPDLMARVNRGKSDRFPTFKILIDGRQFFMNPSGLFQVMPRQTECVEEEKEEEDNALHNKPNGMIEGLSYTVSPSDNVSTLDVTGAVRESMSNALQLHPQPEVVSEVKGELLQEGCDGVLIGDGTLKKSIINEQLHLYQEGSSSYDKGMRPDGSSSYGEGMRSDCSSSYGEGMRPDGSSSYGEGMRPDGSSSYGEGMQLKGQENKEITNRSRKPLPAPVETNIGSKNDQMGKLPEAIEVENLKAYKKKSAKGAKKWKGEKPEESRALTKLAPVKGHTKNTQKNGSNADRQWFDSSKTAQKPPELTIDGPRENSLRQRPVVTRDKQVLREQEKRTQPYLVEKKPRYEHSNTDGRTNFATAHNKTKRKQVLRVDAHDYNRTPKPTTTPIRRVPDSLPAIPGGFMVSGHRTAAYSVKERPKASGVGASLQPRDVVVIDKKQKSAKLDVNDNLPFLRNRKRE